MTKSKYKKWVLVWYSPPVHGGHRQLMTREQFMYQHKSLWEIWLDNGIEPGHGIWKVWDFNTVNQALKADRNEWKERNLDKRFAEDLVFKRIRFE